MAKKSFKEVLETLSSDTTVYVGAKNGSSWIEIDTAIAMLAKMDDLESLLWNRVVSQHKNAEKNLVRIPTEIVKIRSKKEQDSVRLYNLEKEFTNAFILREKMAKIVSAWVPLADRKVVEKYRHPSEPGVCILLEGQDMGTLWLKNEGPVVLTKENN